MNTKPILATLIIVFLAAFGTGALAEKGARGHANKGFKAHPGTMGLPNTNRQSLPTSEKGLDRAQERMNEEGLEHSEAFDQHQATEQKLERKREPQLEQSASHGHQGKRHLQKKSKHSR